MSAIRSSVEDSLELATLLKTEANSLVIPAIIYASLASLYFPSLYNKSARRMAEAGEAEFFGVFIFLYNSVAFSFSPSSSCNVARANRPSK